jgi:hypothetical protein
VSIQVGTRLRSCSTGNTLRSGAGKQGLEFASWRGAGGDKPNWRGAFLGAANLAGTLGTPLGHRHRVTASTSCSVATPPTKRLIRIATGTGIARPFA